MKLTLARDPLHAALGIVARIVEARNTIPILSNVWLSAGEGALKLRATDLDIEASAKVEARIAAPGEITVSAQSIKDIVAKTPTGAEIGIELADGQLTVRAGRARFKLMTLPASDFPDMTVATPTHRFHVAAKTFGEMLARTSFAISHEETRYYLNGIFLHAADRNLRMVATDGHRLARVDGPEISDVEGMPGIIVPRKTVAELARLCAKDTAEIAISLSPSKIACAFAGGVEIVSKLIDGTFPDYSRVIPVNPNTCIADRESFLAAVDRVASLTGGVKGRRVKLSLGDNTMVLEVANPDAGESRDEIDVDFAAPPIQIGFNAGYLAEILGVMTSDQAAMRLSDPGAPALLQAPGDPSATFVIMPLRC